MAEGVTLAVRHRARVCSEEREPDGERLADTDGVSLPEGVWLGLGDAVLDQDRDGVGSELPAGARLGMPMLIQSESLTMMKPSSPVLNTVKDTQAGCSRAACVPARLGRARRVCSSQGWPVAVPDAVPEAAR